MYERGPDEEAISKEFVENLKARDKRFADVDFAIKIEAELRDSEALKIVLEQVNVEAVDSLEKLADVSPTDVNAIVTLQAKIKRARIIGNTLEAIRRRGAIAQRQIEEDVSIDMNAIGGQDDENGHH